MVELTVHAYERSKERGAGKGECAYKNAEKAFVKGKSPEDFDKQTRKYLENVLKGSKGNNIKVWGNNIYLFFDNILITVFPMPAKMNNKKPKKERVVFYGD